MNWISSILGVNRCIPINFCRCKTNQYLHKPSANLFVVCKLHLEGNLLLINSPMLLHAVMKYTIRPNLEFFSKSFWAMCFLKLTVKLYCYELNLESFHLPIALQQGLAKTFCRLLLLFFFVLCLYLEASKILLWCANAKRQQFLRWMKLHACSDGFKKLN